MGVPAFFRWLSKKYPSIVVHCVEEKPKEVDGTKIPVNTSLPNPNDYEFDNLYLDMNGIIHPCSHPENKPAPKNEAEMMVNIFEYIDRIFSIVRPRRLLYMAIDGVAPRAKMNQQRSRRFRAAKESRESREIISNIKQNLREKGALLPPEKEKTEHFDSNCITPGTDFMDRLSGCLRYYIGDRLTNDPGWKNIKVILSDANTPGEGEHKIMDFIRHQRAQPDHDPNTKHCLNGADADLIMLGLATHEVNFTILREEFKPNQKRPCEICAQVGHDKTECEGLPKEKVSENDDIQPFVGQDVEFIFIRLNVLREYLERELKMEGLPFYNFERALDDWIFMCFFVGNDFLPHLPSLEIREGAIDRLVRIYKNCLPQMGGYLGDSGFVNMERVQRILQELGEVEDEIFRKRQQFEEGMKRRRQQNEERNKRQRMEGSDSPGWSPRNYGTPLGRNQTPMESPSYKSFYQNQSTPSPNSRNQNAASDLRMMLRTPDSGATAEKSTPQGDSEARKGLKRPHEDEKKEEKKKEEEPDDHIRLWEEGWKERYYLHKFGVSKDLDPKYFLRFRKHVADEYVLGLCWVLQYYFQGCPSWNWFYPFHYAPFASDFLDIDKVDTTFVKGTGPFNPLEQLMSVFPAASGKFLPPTWRELMQSPDSEIIDFYPTDFKIDLNGKRFAWQGVALLPFVDEKRLHRTLKKVYDDLTEDEKRRNKRDHNMMFMRMGTSLYDFVYGLHENGMLDEKQDIVTDFSNGVRGKVFADDKLVPPGSVHISPVPGQPDLTSTKAFSVRYEDPTYEEGFVFPAKILENATRPERTLKPGDFPADRKWRPQTGMSRNSYSPQHVAPGGHRMLRQELGMNRPPSPYNSQYNSSYHNNPRGHAPYNNSPRQWNSSPRMAPPPWGQVRPPNFYNQPPQRGWEHRGGGHQRSYSNRDTSYQNNQDTGYQNYQRDGDRRRSFPSSNHYRR